MKKFLALALAVAMAALTFAGCGSKGSSANTLTVATSPDFAPMEFVDASKSGQDQYVGFDLSLAKYLAKEMGKTLVVKPMSFDACQTAVEMGSVDMAISGFSWTKTRAENYNLSDYYYAGDNETEQVIITTKANEGKYATVDSLKGVNVAAQTASLQEQLCNEQLADSNIVIVSDLTTALMQLKKGDFECMAVAKGQADVFMANDPEIAFSGFEFEVDPKYVGNVVLMKKGADDLTKTVNDLLAKAYDAGYYGEWYSEAQVLAGAKTAEEVSFDDSGVAATDSTEG